MLGALPTDRRTRPLFTGFDRIVRPGLTVFDKKTYRENCGCCVSETLPVPPPPACGACLTPTGCYTFTGIRVEGNPVTTDNVVSVQYGDSGGGGWHPTSLLWSGASFPPSIADIAWEYGPAIGAYHETLNIFYSLYPLASRCTEDGEELFIGLYINDPDGHYTWPTATQFGLSTQAIVVRHPTVGPKGCNCEAPTPVCQLVYIGGESSVQPNFFEGVDLTSYCGPDDNCFMYFFLGSPGLIDVPFSFETLTVTETYGSLDVGSPQPVGCQCDDLGIPVGTTELTLTITDTPGLVPCLDMSLTMTYNEFSGAWETDEIVCGECSFVPQLFCTNTFLMGALGSEFTPQLAHIISITPLLMWFEIDLATCLDVVGPYIVRMVITL